MAIAVNTFSAVASAKSAAGASYPMLADPNHQVAEAYAVYNVLGDGLAAPAVFVIDRDGRILWSYIGQHAGDRPTPMDILTQLP